MSQRIYRQESKEFQMKVNVDALLDNQLRTPGATDATIYAATMRVLRETLERLSPRTAHLSYLPNGWRREGIRYDTADSALKKHQLTLAIEATDSRTKLKCKSHHFVPEMLYDKPKHSICMPAAQAVPKTWADEAQFKLEQDIHFNNIKYCASGSLFRKGRKTDVRNLDYFSRYFPALTQLMPEDTPLVAVSHWDEAVYDDISAQWDDTRIDSWMLVNRWDWSNHRLLEAELSFKFEKSMKAPWDYSRLKQFNTLYLALHASGFFIDQPPIFTYDNPVSSFNIVPA